MATEIGTRVTSPNTIDTAYDTSLISGGRPHGWPATCIRYNVAAGASNGGTLYFETEQNLSTPSQSTPTTRGWVMEADFIIEDAPNADGVSVSLAVQKEDGGSTDFGEPGVVIATRVYYHRSGLGDNKFLFLIDQDADEVTSVWPSSGSLTLGRSYRIKTLYDIKNKRIAWWVDGELVSEAVMAANNSQNLCTKVHGSSGSSDARDLSWLANFRYWGEIQSFPAKPLRPRIFAPGLAR